MGCQQSKIDELDIGCTSFNSLSRKSFLFSRVLGEGGFGTVRAAQMIFIDAHSMSSEWFAVKEMRKREILKVKSGKRMLFNELNSLKRLEHPYIVGLNFAFHDSLSCFFVLDLLIGGDLRCFINNGVVFDEYKTCYIISCLSSALDYMHSKFILHRDIKPENIIFDEKGYPYITDFGVAYIHENTNEVIYIYIKLN
jgi:serine/threonine protein kinase